MGLTSGKEDLVENDGCSQRIKLEIHEFHGRSQPTGYGHFGQFSGRLSVPAWWWAARFAHSSDAPLQAMKNEREGGEGTGLRIRSCDRQHLYCYYHTSTTILVCPREYNGAMATDNRGSGPRLSVRDQTLETLRRRIISLQLPPGEPLSENELAQELGVSRTPVRESLILLREEGLVQVFPQIGSFVSLVDLGRVSDAQFVREAIECASLKEIVMDAAGLAGLREDSARPVRRRCRR